jgi:hypothetical protein
MEKNSKAIAGYDHLDRRGTGRDSHVLIRGREVRVIDVYLASKSLRKNRLRSRTFPSGELLALR